jgi:phosphatidate cytidylyltransferase
MSPVRFERELAAAIAIPAVLAVLFLLPAPFFDGLVVAVALAALFEFYRLAEKTGAPVAKVLGLAAGLALLCGSAVAHAVRRPVDPGLLAGGLIALGLLAGTAPLFSGVDAAAALSGAGATVLGVLAIPLPATALCALRSGGPGSFGPRAVVFLFLIVWGCDSAAYYIGRRFGRHPLAPRISPKKTVEGSIGGLAGASVIGLLAGAFWILPELGPARGALAAALASSAGQVGDLVESLWKRGAGVKDSGRFLPGHGGFYDRIDSLLFAAPVLALLVVRSASAPI